jgi:hypothetical protein
VWLVRSTGWNAGTTWTHPKQLPNTRYCSLQYPKTVFNTSDGTAIDWSGGWELGAAIDVRGVNLKASYNTTAQTGYDSNALLHFGFRRQGYICGINHLPNKAALLVMRSHK